MIGPKIMGECIFTTCRKKRLWFKVWIFDPQQAWSIYYSSPFANCIWKWYFSGSSSQKPSQMLWWCNDQIDQLKPVQQAAGCLHICRPWWQHCTGVGCPPDLWLACCVNFSAVQCRLTTRLVFRFSKKLQELDLPQTWQLIEVMFSEEVIYFNAFANKWKTNESFFYDCSVESHS